jgi:hypothetical protein
MPSTDTQPISRYRIVEKRGKRVPHFKEHAGDGQEPDRPQHAGAERPAQDAEHERRVAARDQEVDGHVLGDAERALEAAVRQGVVQGRAQVKKKDAGAERDGAHDRAGALVAAQRAADEDGQDGERGEGADAVADAVGDLLAERLLAVARLRIDDARERFHGVL